jgi:hypothetical protein
LKGIEFIPYGKGASLTCRTSRDAKAEGRVTTLSRNVQAKRHPMEREQFREVIIFFGEEERTPWLSLICLDQPIEH